MGGMAPFRRIKQSAIAAEQGKVALLASAVLVKQSQIRAVPEQREWQTRAWDYYDTVGELRFASQWISNALSRCGLHVRSFRTEDSRSDPIPLDQAEGADPRANVPLDELFGGATGHPEMLSRLATHLSVSGESYLIGWDSSDGNGNTVRRWLIASSDEIQKTTSKSEFKVRLPENDKLTTIPLESSTVIRLWRPHPRRAWEADSPVRAALPVLKELMDLSAHITATIESRLAGAGLLLLPESATLPSPLSQPGEPLHEDPAMSTLIDAMITPVHDRDSAAALVPILVRVPDSAVGKAQWMSFSTKLDEKIQDLREASIRRFSTVVDIPAEVMTGMAEANRWNAWKISEDAVKIHLEPLLELICDALTAQYLWPALTSMGVKDPESYCIWYDASNLIQRPNRGPESQNLWEHGLVKTSTVLHANGFTDDDAPDEDEQRRNLLIQLATKGIDPVVVAPYLKALGIEIELPDLPAQRVDESSDPGTLSPGTRERGQPPLPTRLPTRPEALPANTDGEERRAVTASAAPVGSGGTLSFAVLEFGAVRALELAGKRLLNNGSRAYRGQLRDVEPWAIHTHIQAADADDVLSGAYNLLQLCLPDQPCIYATIDSYVRERLALQQPHDRDRLLTMLAEAGCLAGVSRVVA
jgi:hypothetical protein